jgi:hypothetical protein
MRTPPERRLAPLLASLSLATLAACDGGFATVDPPNFQIEDGPPTPPIHSIVGDIFPSRPNNRVFLPGAALHSIEGDHWAQIPPLYYDDGQHRTPVVIRSASQDPLTGDWGIAADDGFYVFDPGHGTQVKAKGLPSSAALSSVLGVSFGNFLVGLSSAGGPGVPLLWRSTIDASGNYTAAPVASGPTSTQSTDGVYDIQSFDSGIFVASTRGVQRSQDNGNTFADVSTGLPAGSPVYKLRAIGSAVYAVTPEGVWLFSGSTWTSYSTGLPQQTGCASLAVADGVLYVAANRFDGAHVYKRAPGDSQWQELSQGIDAPYAYSLDAVPQSIIVINARGNGGATAEAAAGASTLVLGTNAGAFALSGTTWKRFNTGLNNGIITALSAGQNRVALGTYYGDNGFVVSGNGDEGATWITPTDSNLRNAYVTALAMLGDRVIASGPTGYFLGQGLSTAAAGAGGVTFAKLNPFSNNPGNPIVTALAVTGSQFLAAISNPGRQGGIFTSPDGMTFTTASQGFDYFRSVSSFSVRGSDVAAGTDAGVWTSSNGAASWSAAGSLPPSSGSVLSVKWSSTGALYAGLVGTTLAGGTSLVKSSNHGASWTATGSGIPANLGVLALEAYSGPSGETLFAGTSRGLYASTDGGASWTIFARRLASTTILSLAVSQNHLWVGTNGAGTVVYILPAQIPKIVPIVLDVDTGTAHYTTELALTNRGTTAVNVSLQYTASLGGGSGTVTDVLSPGRQLVVPDAMTYFRQKGLPIPVGGAQGGTLLVNFDGASDPEAVAVTARTSALTAAPLPIGRAGLAYAGINPAWGTTGSLMLYGLRTNAGDRTNLAVFSTSNEPVSVKVKVFSGTGDGASAVVAASDTLPPWGWKQYNGILDAAGMTNGYARVERVSTTGRVYAYAVVNDNKTNDGSFLLPASPTIFPDFQNVPVLVETGSFVSELVLANSAATVGTFTLTYRESLSGTGSGSATLTLPPQTQLILPNAIAWLRTQGVPIGPAGAASYAGSLHVAYSGITGAEAYAGARTSSLAPGGGEFGLFSGPFTPGGQGDTVAYVYGLRADADNRSNVAAVNVGAPGDGSITLSIQAYDGDAGGAAKGQPAVLTLAPGQWQQLNDFLRPQGIANGWAKVTRTSGSAPWIAYGVINDGGQPGQRTGDGAYVPMSR